MHIFYLINFFIYNVHYDCRQNHYRIFLNYKIHYILNNMRSIIEVLLTKNIISVISIPNFNKYYVSNFSLNKNILQVNSE